MMAFLAGLQLPRLKHLDLSGWPVGDEGARVLASSAAFAGLTRLNLRSCAIGDAGARALFASGNLRRLMELDLSGNDIQTAASVLLDPVVLPELRSGRMAGNRIAEKVRAAIRDARPLII
jgi:hypothetical protein